MNCRKCSRATGSSPAHGSSRIIKPWRAHQRSPNQHALPLALRQKFPWTLAQRMRLDPPQDSVGRTPILIAHLTPITNLRITPADDGFERRLIVVHHLMHARTDQPDPSSKIAPVKSSIGFPEHANRPGSRRQVSSKRPQQRSLPRPISPKNRPMLSAPNPPINRLKNHSLALNPQPTSPQSQAQ